MNPPFFVKTENSDYKFDTQSFSDVKSTELICIRTGLKPRVFRNCKILELEIGKSMLFSRDNGVTVTSIVLDVEKL